MKLKEVVGIVLFLLLLSGCVANFSTGKYVEGNTFVSERMPTVEIQASSGFTLADTDNGDRAQDLVSDFGAHDSFGMKRFEADYFNEKNSNILLKIKTEYTTKSGWSLGGPNFKNWPGVKIIIADQQINGRRFDTAIIQEVTGQDILLGKVYSAVYEPQARVTIIVTKTLQQRMFDSPPYSKEAEGILSEFNALADNSFEFVK